MPDPKKKPDTNGTRLARLEEAFSRFEGRMIRHMESVDQNLERLNKSQDIICAFAKFGFFVLKVGLPASAALVAILKVFGYI